MFVRKAASAQKVQGGFDLFKSVEKTENFRKTS